jgi:hypothetical protein
LVCRTLTMTPQDAYNELCYYTLAHRDPAFIHQHVVDAYAAQHADAETKPIKLTFALVGLYLQIEKGLSGRQVQRVHMELAQRKQQWPMLLLPKERGTMTAADVMAVQAGPERDRAIHAWCALVWSAFHECRPTIVHWLRERGIE